MSAGAERFFLDTNVLLYLLDPRDDKKQRVARDWILSVWASSAGCVSWQVLNEFYFNGVTKLRWPTDMVRSVIQGFVVWEPVPNTLTLAQRSWYWMDHAQLSYWDGLIIAAAEQGQCRYLISEDFQAGRRYGNVLAVNPFVSRPEDYGLEVLIH